ncbi:MAG: hypothetical protein MUE73_05330 [Planctomycetes bacterium]|nr:hypothetical protein [Planctomycetota bacterium]
MRRLILAAGSLFLALAVLAGPASAGWWDEVAETKTVALSDLTSRPHDFRGQEVRFDCVFHQISEFYNPYFTRFAPTIFVNFAAWPAGAELWREDVYLASHPFLFLDRSADALKTLLALPRFSRLRLTGVVQEVFKGTAWIEVRELEVLPDPLTRDALSLLVRGDRAAAEGNHEAALSLYREASRSPLPAEVRRSVARMEAAALAKLGRAAEARQTLAAALAETPDDEMIRKQLADLDGPGAPPPPVASPPAPAATPPAPAAAPPAPAVRAPAAPAPAPVEAPDARPAAAPPPPAPVEAPAAAPAKPTGPDSPAPAAPAPPKKRLAGPM